jgi:hypothetical protein
MGAAADKKSVRKPPAGQKPREVYEAKPGARLSKEAVEDLGPIIARLARQGLGPESLLKEAVDPRSPAHKHFEWYDPKAAHERRLDQARYFFRSITIRIETIEQPVRLAHPVQIENTTQWMHINQIRESADEMQQLVARARKELYEWYRRYQQIRAIADLNPVFAAIEELQKPAP